MKITDIKEGGTYLAKLGGKTYLVRVAVQRRSIQREGREENVTMYRCTRVDTREVLPQLISPRAIEPWNGQEVAQS